MAIPKVGQTTADFFQLGRRDAFHFPGVLVSSTEYVFPMARVCFTDQSCTAVIKASTAVIPSMFSYHAIVDPFIPDTVIRPGTLFWVFPVPDLVGAVAHHFELSIPPVIPAQQITVTGSIVIPEPAPDKAEPEPSSDDDDTQCAGCYGEDEDEEEEEDDEEDDACKGCYS
jgi:hypothetical protein